MVREREAAFVLACASGVGPVTAARLIERYGSHRSVIEAAMAGGDLPEAVSAAIAREVNGGGHRAELEASSRTGVRFAIPGDADYPPVLREIASPPVGLFVRGARLSGLAPMVGVVGTRAPTHRGPACARRLAAGLAAAGITVVSGLARGIDTAAHRGALDAGGTTVAVVGTGLDRTYPPENAGLSNAIAESGALVSEFPMGAGVRPSSFPRRNRLIAGLSAGVVVVEAGERSGALITAARALEQGRDVFAVPGPVDEPQSRGPNRLIKDGAKLVEDVGDILVELDAAWGPFAVGHAGAVERSRDGPSDESEAGPPGRSRGAAAERILSCLSSTPASVDEIVTRATLEPGEVVAVLFELELVGAVRACPGGRYVAGRRGRR